MMKLVKSLFKKVNKDKKKCLVCSWLLLSFVSFLLFWDVLAAIEFINKISKGNNYCHKKIFLKIKISKGWIMMEYWAEICQQAELLVKVLLIIHNLKVILKFLISLV